MQTDYTPEQIASAQRFLEEHPPDPNAAPVPAQLREALKPLIGDRRWMSDDVSEVIGWLGERFQDPTEYDPRLRALLFITLSILGRMAEGTPGSLEPLKVKKLLRDPVTSQVVGVVEGTMPSF